MAERSLTIGNGLNSSKNSEEYEWFTLVSRGKQVPERT